MKKLYKKLIILLSFILFSGNNAFSENYYYKFNNKESDIKFYFATTLHPVNGVVKNFKGFINAKTDEKDNIVSADGLVEISADSLFTNQSQRDSRMKSETLSVSKFPLIKFKMNDAKVTSNKIKQENTLYMRLIGTLTIRDVTKNVQIPVKIIFTPDMKKAKVEGRYTVNFKEYNVPDPSLPIVGKVEEQINIEFNLSAY